MTLITNLYNVDYIIMAADTQADVEQEDQSRESYIGAKKLFCGDNYCIGIQGTVKHNGVDYVKKLEEFIANNPYLPPPDITTAIIHFFSAVPEEIGDRELNLTISGAHESKLFSFYVKLKAGNYIDCVIRDELGLRFNEANKGSMTYHSQGIIFISRFLKQQKLIDGFVVKDFTPLKKEDIINSLKAAYKNFDKNDIRFNGIGGDMRYCVIHKDGRILKELE